MQKFSTQEKEVLKKFASIGGKIGGAKTKKKYGKEHYSRIGKMGNAKRWGAQKDPVDNSKN